MSVLFSPFTLKNKTIKNRIVMPPMVCFTWGDESGRVSGKHIEHYAKRAGSNIGMIIVEAACVLPEGRLSHDQIGIWDDLHIEGLSKLADSFRENNVLSLIQIHHAGQKYYKNKDSSWNLNNIKKNELQRIRDAFIKGARRAQKAGFDGIELHGAHGYLLTQLANRMINQRTDEYGGNAENRLRFAKEVMEGIRSVCGEDFIIGVRMGGFEPDLEDGREIALLYESFGADILHVSSGYRMESWPVVPENFDFNYIVYVGCEIAKCVSVPVIVVNNIQTQKRANQILEESDASFAAIGRPILVDPEWAMQKEGLETSTLCYNCRNCSWFSDPKNCPGLKK